MLKPPGTKTRDDPFGYVLGDPEAVGDVNPWRMTWALLRSNEKFVAAQAEHIAFK
jgi:hypothetical protein